jgi:flagellar assembly protein FliH
MKPEDEMTAFERWEAGPASPTATTRSPDDLPAAQAEPVAESTPPAGDAAFAAGYAAGLREGEAAAERLRQLADGFSRLIETLEVRLADGVRDLALDVARQVIVGELAARPAVIHDVVRLALQQMTETSREARLVLHPDDAVLVRSKLEGTLDRSRVRLVEDTRMVRGGCRIETAHGDIDASLPTRWRQVVSTLGSHANWADPA